MRLPHRSVNKLYQFRSTKVAIFAKCLSTQSHLGSEPLKMFAKICLVVPSVLFSILTRAQVVDSTFKTPKFFFYDSLHQKDIADVGRSVFGKKKSPRADTGNESQAHVSVL